ncbi:MAG: Na/Pi cotransporter family protein, partial [Candidatus Methanomethylophilus sp.]|nr:Na/Pi cotransporter family protein [Methanomethylophilus sp.]
LAGIDNLVVLVLIGAALTALVQSSSIMTAVIITMIGGGLIGLNQGIYLTIGSNIGSCVVAIMAGMTGGLNAKRTALIHLLFNVFGALIFIVFGFVLICGFNTDYGALFSGMFPSEQIDLAMFHTVFNVVTVLVMLPLTGMLINVVMRIVPDKTTARGESVNGPHLYFVDDNMLKTPAIAVGEVKNEILNMAQQANENFHRSLNIIRTLDMTERQKFADTEDQLDYTARELTHFLLKLSNTKLSDRDSVYISTAFRTINDLERVGDYAENIVEYAEKLKAGNESFSDIACAEIDNVEGIVENLYHKIMAAYKARDEITLEEAYDIEETVDNVTDEMADNHIERLGQGVCSPTVGAEFLSMTSDIERIADHYINVGKTIRELQ